MDIKTVIPLLACPRCSSLLEIEENNIRCKLCNCVFPKKKEVIDFVLEDNKKGEIYDYYDDKYLTQHPDLDYKHASWKALLISSLLTFNKVKKSIRVLDIGCGSGQIMSEFSKIVNVSIGVGVDLSAGHLQVARRKNPQFSYFQASADHLPFSNSSFDVGIMTDLLEHVENVELVLTEAKRVCKSLLIKVPLEGCLEGWIIHKLLLPDFRDRCGHVQAFNLNSIHKLSEQNGRIVVKEVLAYTPFDLSDWQIMPFRSRFFYLIRLLLRFGGKNFYRQICPMWYVALIK